MKGFTYSLDNLIKGRYLVVKRFIELDSIKCYKVKDLQTGEYITFTEDEVK